MIGKRSYTQTGIDISDRSVELVEIEYKANKIKDKKYLYKKIPIATTERGEIKSIDAFDRIFNDLLDKAEKKEFEFDNVTLSLPEEFITHKVITLKEEKKEDKDKGKSKNKDESKKDSKKNKDSKQNKKKDDEKAPSSNEKSLEERIMDEIKNDLLEISPKWQYEIFEVQVKGETQYIFIGIPTNKLEDYVKHISEFGIEVDNAEPDSTSLARNLDFSEEGDLVVDFGANKIILYFYLSGILYKRKIIKWGANKIIDKLAAESKLSMDKEEKFFERVGYGSRASKKQKEIIKKYFDKFNKKLESFIKKIKKDLEIDIEQIYVTGGLSKIIGLKNLLPDDISYKKLQSIVILDDKIDYINSLGSAIREDENDINFITDEIKEEIKKSVEEKTAKREKELIEKELDKNEENSKEVNKLTKVFLDKWGELPKDVEVDNWTPSLKFTSIVQFLLVIIIGLAGIFFIQYYTSENKYQAVLEENEANSLNTQRDFVTFAFPLNISTGENIITGEEASIIADFEEIVIEAEDTYVISGENQILTQEAFDAAKIELEEKIRNGELIGNKISTEENEMIIRESVQYEESLAASDIEVGSEAETFTMTLRARTTFPIVSKDRFDQIIRQRLLVNLKQSENIEEYTAQATDYLLIEFLDESNNAQINVYVEAEK